MLISTDMKIIHKTYYNKITPQFEFFSIYNIYLKSKN